MNNLKFEKIYREERDYNQQLSDIKFHKAGISGVFSINLSPAIRLYAEIVQKVSL